MAKACAETVGRANGGLGLYNLNFHIRHELLVSRTRRLCYIESKDSLRVVKERNDVPVAICKQLTIQKNRWFGACLAFRENRHHLEVFKASH